jgi:hypothetical protein
MSESGDIDDTDDLGGRQSNDPERLVRLFQRELEARKVTIVEREGTDDFVLDIRGVPITISLDELRYDYERDADAQLVARFVASLVDTSEPLPAWTKARSRIFLSVDSTQAQVDDAVSREVTKLLALTVVHAGPEERFVSPITRKQLTSWQVSEDAVLQVGCRNLSGLLEETPLEVRRIGPLTTAVFTSRSYFKPALIFSPNFKEKVAPQLGWPVLALVPCREDVFLLRDNFLEKECKETERFLNFVIQEFLESRHGLTPEVLRISEKGIESLTIIGFS